MVGKRQGGLPCAFDCSMPTGLGTEKQLPAPTANRINPPPRPTLGIPGAKKTIQQRFPKWDDPTSAWVAILIAAAMALATWAGAWFSCVCLCV